MSRRSTSLVSHLVCTDRLISAHRLRKSLAALHAAAADHYEKATVYDSERMPIY